MFWKKQVAKKEDMDNAELPVAEHLAGWLKTPGGDSVVKWLDELKKVRLLCLLDKTDLTNDELQFRKGEISALKMIASMIKEIRLVKDKVDEPEEGNG